MPGLSAAMANSFDRKFYGQIVKKRIEGRN
jgi:hypothetical protein